MEPRYAAFSAKHGQAPQPWDAAQAQAFVKLAETLNAASDAKVDAVDTDLMTLFAYTCAGVLPPLCAAVGGWAAQEVPILPLLLLRNLFVSGPRVAISKLYYLQFRPCNRGVGLGCTPFTSVFIVFGFCRLGQRFCRLGQRLLTHS